MQPADRSESFPLDSQVPSVLPRPLHVCTRRDHVIFGGPRPLQTALHSLIADDGEQTLSYC